MKSNIHLSRYSFAVFYAVIVASITQSLAHFPVLLQMEFAIYDPLQRWFTIDTKEDYLYSKYKKKLNEIYCINLDDSFFVHETQRVDRKKLSTLIQKFHNHSFKTLFLDFLFEPLHSNSNQSRNADSLLQQSMKPMEYRLIMPYALEFESSGICKEYSISDIKSRSTQIYLPFYSGFTAPLYLDGDNLRRYHQFRLGDGNEVSAINTLIKSNIGKEKMKERFKHIPDKFEINYVFRNEKQFGKPDAKDIIEAYQVLNKSFNELRTDLKNKVIFIGRFKPKMDHFDKPIDGFDTPIKSNMNGIYFLINAYLNVMENSYFKRAGFWFVFLINFIFAVGGVFYYDNQKDEAVYSVLHEIRDVSIFIAIFIGLIVGLYFIDNLKFSFVVSTLFIIKLKTIKNYFKALAAKL